MAREGSSRIRRAGSVLPAASLHGAVNALWNLTVAITKLEGAAGEAAGGLRTLGLASLAAVWLALKGALKVGGKG